MGYTTKGFCRYDIDSELLTSQAALQAVFADLAAARVRAANLLIEQQITSQLIKISTRHVRLFGSGLFDTIKVEQVHDPNG